MQRTTRQLTRKYAATTTRSKGIGRHDQRPAAPEPRLIGITAKNTPGWFAWERAWKQPWEIITAPIVRILARLGITPTTITVIRLPIALAGFLMIGAGKSGWGAAVVMLSLLLDTIDGALARHTRTMTHRGTFLDRVSDYATYCLSVITMIFLGEVGGLTGAINVFAVFTAVILRVIALNEGEKTDWIINPQANLVWFQIFWFIAFFWHAWIGHNGMNETLFWLNVFLAINAAQSYTTILGRWAKAAP